MVTHRLRITGELDLRRSLRPLGLAWSMRTQDGWWKAMRTPVGPATIRVWRHGDDVAAEGWGPGRDWALERLGDLIGEHDDAGGWVPDHPLISELWRNRPGLRIGRTNLVFEALVFAVLGQKVTGKEAARGLRGLTWRFSDPAPGPHGHLRLPPDPLRLAESPYHAFHDLGIEKKRADTIRRLAADAGRIERLAARGVAEATRHLARFPGVGEWTVNETLVVSHGHTDAVSVGDYHLKHVVAWHLAGQDRGNDEQMLALLEPFRPHRARVVRLLEAAGRPPRRGPRMAVRGFESF